jgi:peptidyl-prolyl cis-trans isomerase D
MLKWMRDQFKNLKIVLWFVVFVFILLIFVDWGTGRKGARGLTGLAAKVGGHDIPEAEFFKAVKSIDDRYRQMYGKQYDQIRKNLDLASAALSSIVERDLLTRQAHAMGLSVSDQELLDKILTFPVFRRKDGSFVGENLYSRILSANQMTPEEFESDLRSELLIQKLQHALSAGVVVTDAELEREYRRRNETISMSVVVVPVDKAYARATVTDAEVKAYYDGHQERFTHPEQRQLHYLLVDDAKLRQSITVPQAQVKEYYATHQKDFAKPEEIQAQHILIRPATDDDSGWKAALAKAQEVYAKATAPHADFAALAKQYSQDPGSKDSGGELGWFSRGRMVKEFEDAAFALKVGEISHPVKSQYGYHVIRLEGRHPAGEKTFDEVSSVIRNTIAEGLADAEGSRRANALREKIDAAKLTTADQWKTLSDDTVTSNETPLFATTDQFIPGLGRDPELLAEVAKAGVGFVGGPRKTPRGWIVYRLTLIRAAGVTPWDEAKDAAREGARRAKALTILEQEIAQKRSTGGADPLKAIATAYGVAPQEVKDHKRGSAIPGIGASEPFEDAAFATPIGGVSAPVAVGERGVAVARVTAKKTFDPATFAKDRPALRSELVEQRSERLLQAMLEELKRENPVTVNPAVVDRFKPEQG